MHCAPSIFAQRDRKKNRGSTNAENSSLFFSRKKGEENNHASMYVMHFHTLQQLQKPKKTRSLFPAKGKLWAFVFSPTVVCYFVSLVAMTQEEPNHLPLVT